MASPSNLFAGVPIGAPIGFCAVVVLFAVVLLRGRRRPGATQAPPEDRRPD